MECHLGCKTISEEAGKQTRRESVGQIIWHQGQLVVVRRPKCAGAAGNGRTKGRPSRAPSLASVGGPAWLASSWNNHGAQNILIV